MVIPMNAWRRFLLGGDHFTVFKVRVYQVDGGRALVAPDRHGTCVWVDQTELWPREVVEDRWAHR